MNESLTFKDRSLILRLCGLLLFLAGLFLALLVPLENHTLTFFSAGGRFAYEGFGLTVQPTEEHEFQLLEPILPDPFAPHTAAGKSK